MMSFLTGVVSTLVGLVVALGVWYYVKFPETREGLRVIAVILSTHILAFAAGAWWGRL